MPDRFISFDVQLPGAAAEVRVGRDVSRVAEVRSSFNHAPDGELTLRVEVRPAARHQVMTELDAAPLVYLAAPERRNGASGAEPSAVLELRMIAGGAAPLTRLRTHATDPAWSDCWVEFLVLSPTRVRGRLVFLGPNPA